ncbi:HNH endonuclease signature motif containing protein [Pseudodesulfovibrio senegalensis]|uniref:HNH endonuclease n=1 Tax=Pseudodesulfovibrio senegalensis TaxID=1721087 RepID=A0A6N6N1D2_9BACT|nr:HNH endonuclease signature motif containing protein [Pseudodesulfovibrio senegalensis]KAB1440353.1 HNH endonuclease [Pseudodesulfovibrio senegalensis]
MTTQELTDAFNERFEPKRTFWAIEGQLKRRGFVKYHRRTLKTGDETLCPATGYITVKTDSPAPNMKTKRNYRYKHLVVWEEANGPVPDGMYIRFLDGDKTNCSLDNLVMVSMAEHAILNKLNLKELHPDLRATAIATARLQAKCIKLETANR